MAWGQGLSILHDLLHKINKDLDSEMHTEASHASRLRNRCSQDNLSGSIFTFRETSLQVSRLIHIKQRRQVTYFFLRCSARCSVLCLLPGDKVWTNWKGSVHAYPSSTQNDLWTRPSSQLAKSLRDEPCIVLTFTSQGMLTKSLTPVLYYEQLLGKHKPVSQCTRVTLSHRHCADILIFAPSDPILSLR